MPQSTLNVALIGYQFMGKAHSNAWDQVPHFFDLPLRPVMHTICGRNEDALRVVADRWGWKNMATDYMAAIADPEVQLVDIATPNSSHLPIVLAAAAAGKMVACEKPLARNLKEAREMAAAVKKAGVLNFVWFNYRRVPALALARQLIRQGRIGRIYHVRAVYLQQWIKDAKVPLVWRATKEIAGSGALGDLAAHLVDMTRFLTGDEFAEVCGLTQTFVTRREAAGVMKEGLTAGRKEGRGKSGKAGQGGRGVHPGRYTAAQLSRSSGKVDVDDAVLFLARLKSGGIGTFEATRFATGHNNGNCIEINGEKGALKFHFPDFSFLDFWDDTLPESEKGWRRISATVGQDPYSGHYWPADHNIGYAETFVNTAADIVRRIGRETKEFHADFEDGVRCQEVLEAAEISARERRWVKLSEMN